METLGVVVIVQWKPTSLVGKRDSGIEPYRLLSSLGCLCLTLCPPLTKRGGAGPFDNPSGERGVETLKRTLPTAV